MSPEGGCYETIEKLKRDKAALNIQNKLIHEKKEEYKRKVSNIC